MRVWWARRSPRKTLLNTHPLTQRHISMYVCLYIQTHPIYMHFLVCECVSGLLNFNVKFLWCSNLINLTWWPFVWIFAFHIVVIVVVVHFIFQLVFCNSENETLFPRNLLLCIAFTHVSNKRHRERLLDRISDVFFFTVAFIALYSSTF